MQFATSRCNPTQGNSPALCRYNAFVKFRAAQASRLIEESPLQTGGSALSNLQLQLRMRQHASAAATGRTFLRHSGIVVTWLWLVRVSSKDVATVLSLPNPIFQKRSTWWRMFRPELSLQSCAHDSFSPSCARKHRPCLGNRNPCENTMICGLTAFEPRTHTQMTFTVIECFRYLLRQPPTVAASCAVEMVRWWDESSPWAQYGTIS